MPSYSTNALVLKKTKLGEKDLVVTLLSADGRQLKAVAKGGRQPGSKVAANVELFSHVDLLLNQGRSLDTISESQAVAANAACRRDPEHAAAAALVAELLEKVTRESFGEERLFPLACAAFAAVGDARSERLRLIAAATVLKTLAQIGFRPALDECANCGSPVPAPEVFVVAEGGVLCRECAPFSPETAGAGAEAVPWLRCLLYSRFAELLALDGPCPGAALLDTALDWAEQHACVRLKSAAILQDLLVSEGDGSD